MHSFLIVGIPEGEAPSEIREAWCGVILQGVPIVPQHVLGVLSGKPSAGLWTGYMVNARDAIRRLESHPDGSLVRRRAAEWWRNHLVGVTLIFDEACCQRVEG